ncbi:UNVERIFIED_CONTAM: hypothetical protein PYX00_011577 [Menopon gallinae]|uniref:Uncharacterized protein n=1 Tax=Menopon gallinae TaxID=328185 RepID=A0AAW2H856_9NEOP
MGRAASLAALAAVLALSHAACGTVHPRVLVWGTSTGGLGDVESILAIRDFVTSRGGRPTVAILVTSRAQLETVQSHLGQRNEDDLAVLASDVEQCVPERVNLVEHFIPSWYYCGYCREIDRKKRDAEEKLRHMGAAFDRAVCYLNSACVLYRGALAPVTPENSVEGSLTIREYSGSTETLWLGPRGDTARGSYYFAYFYNEYSDITARFLVSLRELLPDAGGRVRVVTNTEHSPEDMAKYLARVFGHSSWSSSLRAHWTESNPEAAALLRENGIVVHESDDKLAGVEMCGVVFELESIGRVSAARFDSLLFGSGEYAGCTGDSSLSKVLSSGRVPLYQVLEHKKEFVGVLRKWWTETGGDGQRFDRMMLRYHEGRRLQLCSAQYAASLRAECRRFVDRLFERTTQDVLETDALFRCHSHIVAPVHAASFRPRDTPDAGPLNKLLP